MIKVNLLDSVTDKTSVAAIETRVANPRTQGRLVLLVVVALTALAMGFDWMSARSAHAEATAELQRQQEIAARMQAINKQQSEFKKDTERVQMRIDAIKKLRASQQGPVAVLSAINARLPNVPNFRLESIEQKGGELILKGDSPNEAAVTQFSRNIEDQSGMFSNVSIETKRELLETVTKAAATPGAEDKDAPKPETVTFTLKCNYTPAASSSSSSTNAAPAPNQVAQR